MILRVVSFSACRTRSFVFIGTRRREGALCSIYLLFVSLSVSFGLLSGMQWLALCLRFRERKGSKSSARESERGKSFGGIDRVAKCVAAKSKKSSPSSTRLSVRGAFSSSSWIQSPLTPRLFSHKLECMHACIFSSWEALLPCYGGLFAGHRKQTLLYYFAVVVVVVSFFLFTFNLLFDAITADHFE